MALIWSIYSLQFLKTGIFWDLGIYEKAVSSFHLGENPYALTGYLSFVYHPLVLRFMAMFGTHLKEVLILLYIGSLTFFLISLRNIYMGWLSSFLAFAYCGVGTISIGSGNITVFMHLILLGVLLNSIALENKDSEISYNPFILSALVFSIVKPYMLSYLFIPIIISWGTPHGHLIRRNIAIKGIAVLMILLASSIYFGNEFYDFLIAVKRQTIGKHDLGYGIAMFFYEYYSSAGNLIYRAFALQFIIVGALIVLALWLSKRNGLIQSPNFVLLLYFLLTLANPRLKVYDLFPALIALFIFFFSIKPGLWFVKFFVVAYTLSLFLLYTPIPLRHVQFLLDPLNIYYLTIGIIFAAIIVIIQNTRSTK
jgi:hypothetical protein